MPEPEIRPYQASEDAAACRRVWHEAGWVDGAKNETAFAEFVESARSLVGLVDGSPECLVNVHAGLLRYLDEDLPLACISGVATSRVARRRGLAARTTAAALAEEARAGTPVAAIGVFEQGFYNRLGFGNGPYQNWCTFDPAQLTVAPSHRAPVRVCAEDWQAVHEARLSRRRWHGTASITEPRLTHAEMLWGTESFGLGFRDAGGNLTHLAWCSPEKPQRGPYTVEWMSFATRDQFLELLGILKAQGDQVHSMAMAEPPGLQLQDLLAQPFKGRRVTESSPHVQRMRADAYWQIRILDLRATLAQTHLSSPVRFQLDLDDPISEHLEPAAPWRGIAGRYVVDLGDGCSVRAGEDLTLPVLHASVGAFSRLWLGVRSATSLSWTDSLAGPPTLLAALDRAFLLPSPASDWDY